MNLKKAKRIRQQLRFVNIEWSDAEYDLDRRSKNLAAKNMLSPFQVTIALVESCGRKVYKRMKRGEI